MAAGSAQPCVEAEELGKPIGSFGWKRSTSRCWDSIWGSSLPNSETVTLETANLLLLWLLVLFGFIGERDRYSERSRGQGNKKD